MSKENWKAVRQIDEGAVFVVDTVSYFNQITPLDLTLVTQTISYTAPDPSTLANDDDTNGAPRIAAVCR